jgi:imidazole glycerol-phosphate synthase subunit HisH
MVPRAGRYSHGVCRVVGRSSPVVAVLDYGSGNVRSVAKALEAVGATVHITRDKALIKKASHLVLPGVGAFAACAAGVRDAGLLPILEENVQHGGKPLLGICVGMQLLATIGHENGTTRGLGWIAGEVVRLPDTPPLKIPHMGWNQLLDITPHPLLRGITQGDWAYFVHSYHFVPNDSAVITAQCSHGLPFTAMLAKGPVAGVQFHPEKSQTLGLTLLENFTRWYP